MSLFISKKSLNRLVTSKKAELLRDHKIAKSDLKVKYHKELDELNALKAIEENKLDSYRAAIPKWAMKDEKALRLINQLIAENPEYDLTEGKQKTSGWTCSESIVARAMYYYYVRRPNATNPYPELYNTDWFTLKQLDDLFSNPLRRVPEGKLFTNFKQSNVYCSMKMLVKNKVFIEKPRTKIEMRGSGRKQYAFGAAFCPTPRNLIEEDAKELAQQVKAYRAAREYQINVNDNAIEKLKQGAYFDDAVVDYKNDSFHPDALKPPSQREENKENKSTNSDDQITLAESSETENQTETETPPEHIDPYTGMPFSDEDLAKIAEEEAEAQKDELLGLHPPMDLVTDSLFKQGISAENKLAQELSKPTVMPPLDISSLSSYLNKGKKDVD